MFNKKQLCLPCGLRMCKVRCSEQWLSKAGFSHVGIGNIMIFQTWPYCLCTSDELSTHSVHKHNVCDVAQERCMWPCTQIVWVGRHMRNTRIVYAPFMSTRTCNCIAVCVTKYVMKQIILTTAHAQHCLRYVYATICVLTHVPYLFSWKAASLTTKARVFP